MSVLIPISQDYCVSLMRNTDIKSALKSKNCYTNINFFFFFCHWSRKISSLKISLDRLNNSTYHWVFTYLFAYVSVDSIVYFHYLFWLDRKGYMLPFCVIVCVHMCGVHCVCGTGISIFYFYLYICHGNVLFSPFFSTQ